MPNTIKVFTDVAILKPNEGKKHTHTHTHTHTHEEEEEEATKKIHPKIKQNKTKPQKKTGTTTYKTIKTILLITTNKLKQQTIKSPLTSFSSSIACLWFVVFLLLFFVGIYRSV